MLDKDFCGVMAILTQKTIIFKCYIDKLIKTLYNKIWLLVKTDDIRRVLCLLSSLLLVLDLGVSRLSVSAEETRSEAISLRIVEETEDLICVAVCLALDKGICGFFADILYDTERIRFLSVCAAPEEGGGNREIEAAEYDGGLSLIVDSDANDLCGHVALLSFEKLSEIYHAQVLEICVREAYSFSEKGLASVTLSGGTTVVGERREESLPRLAEAELAFLDGSPMLLLRGVSDIGGVAAGFFVTVTAKNESGSFESVSAAPRSGEAPMEFFLEVAVPHSGYACIAVCPLIYVGRNIVRGDVTVYTLYDGNLLTVQGHIKQ